MTSRSNSRSGERNGMAKLTETQVREILRDARGQRATARAYGVHRRTIARIRKGLRWAHVSENNTGTGGFS